MGMGYLLSKWVGHYGKVSYCFERQMCRQLSVHQWFMWDTYEVYSIMNSHWILNCHIYSNWILCWNNSWNNNFNIYRISLISSRPWINPACEHLLQLKKINPASIVPTRLCSHTHWWWLRRLRSLVHPVCTHALYCSVCTYTQTEMWC